MNSSTEKDTKTLVLFRRLLLAKQMYQHGLVHSEQAGALNKMIAIHSLHNAIEITLKAIILHYDIRPEKPFNISFDEMWKEIDKAKHQKLTGKKLPYGQRMRSLNSQRNLIQHDAAEPPDEMIVEWRFFTHLFLSEVFSNYFGFDFDELSQVNLVTNLQLRELLLLAQRESEEDNHQTSVIISKLVYDWCIKIVSISLFDERTISNRPFRFSSREKLSEVYFDDSHNKEIRGTAEKFERAIEESLAALDMRTRQSAYYTIMLSIGVSQTDYLRFQHLTPIISSNINLDRLFLYWKSDTLEINQTSASWVLGFVTNAIIQWQNLGFELYIPEHFQKPYNKIIEGNYLWN